LKLFCRDSQRTEVPESRRIAALESPRSSILVRMIKPNLFGHLTTGMFNLIVKDPRRTPPERAAWIG